MPSKIPLKKEVYEAQKARNVLNPSFFEFSPELRNIEEFFNIYNNKFYSILNTTHEYFVKTSLEYIKSYVNPKQITIKNLQTELSNIQFEIDSVERTHPIFSNGLILSPMAPSMYESLDNCDLYYIQSGKSRKIKGNNKLSLFALIKSQQRKTSISNEDFIITVNNEVIENLPKTKPIEFEEDLNDSFLTLNNYNGPTD